MWSSVFNKIISPGHEESSWHVEGAGKLWSSLTNLSSPRCLERVHRQIGLPSLQLRSWLEAPRFQAKPYRLHRELPPSPRAPLLPQWPGSSSSSRRRRNEAGEDETLEKLASCKGASGFLRTPGAA